MIQSCWSGVLAALVAVSSWTSPLQAGWNLAVGWLCWGVPAAAASYCRWHPDEQASSMRRTAEKKTPLSQRWFFWHFLLTPAKRGWSFDHPWTGTWLLAVFCCLLGATLKPHHNQKCSDCIGITVSLCMLTDTVQLCTCFLAMCQIFLTIIKGWSHKKPIIVSMNDQKYPISVQKNPFSAAIYLKMRSTVQNWNACLLLVC